MEPLLLVRPGTLWTAIVERTCGALAAGALQPITTEQRFVDDGGVRFAIRQLPSLARKGDAGRPRSHPDGRSRNPFLPCEQELLVAPLTSTHLALLNKYNVIAHHLLLVTRRFEQQEALLDHDDFFALAACLREFAGLAFYNGGAAAGASQRHKHLQYVPLPLADGMPGAPVEVLFLPLQGRQGIGTVPEFAFRHGFAWLDEVSVTDVCRTAEVLWATYRQLLAAVGLGALPGTDEQRQSAPYNLLATRRWMLVVPRAHEQFGSLSINALAYAGSLFVRNEEQFEMLRRAGPMTALRDVAVR